ncbi:polyprenyl synthetase family protein [Nesterenkonia xinjiangensis]|uniref:Geranylgeranyl diphosphate synthase type I n=1 Tax=Nesterenkonia xinjiangensis TaxID=225327 RepID=A0A7Z0GQH1_9MICC|nr:polyprenyl synthetase family protein [Nesterenkonia xinjiangensis]NYJ79243.1 geranylgeranyl diphosphate synthase type I [Nesterenkonia xinjiangensis]
MRTPDFIAHVTTCCTHHVDERRLEVAEISPDAAPLVETLAALTRGGKRLRPVLAWIGWRAAGGEAGSHPALDRLTVSLELFQAAALVHDDVIDRSATRRGQPSTHRRFETLHGQQAFTGDPVHFGTSGAILAGDLALSWAGEAFAGAEAAARDRHGAEEALAAARRSFQQMHTQVITGQYLDVHAEVAPAAEDEGQAVVRARQVLRYKAARYSTEHPVVLGAALAGAQEPLRRLLAAAALPVGEAFQLRDDLLGVFGDPETTGKPVGDDLREGKRTELVAYGLFRSPAPAARELEAMLGDPELSAASVERAREILTDAGAVAEVERSIESLLERSHEEVRRLREAGVAEDVLTDLQDVSDRLVRRSR